MDVCPVRAFSGMTATVPIATFHCSWSCAPITLSDVQRERALNTEELLKRIAELHPLVETTLRSSRRRIRDTRSKGSLPSLMEGDFVLVACNDFTSGEQLSLRWGRPRHV